MCEHRKGYVIAAFNFTNMLEVERDDSMNIYEDDEQAVEAAVADGSESSRLTSYRRILTGVTMAG